MPESFDDYEYTRESILKQLVLSELHSKDGSAVDAGCGCIEGKHTLALEGLCEEMVGFAKSEAEKQFYSWLGEVMRTARRKIEFADWCIPCNPAPSHRCGVCHAKN